MTEQAVGLRRQNHQKPVLFPQIRSSAQVAQMGADKNPIMEAAKDGFTDRNQLGNGNNNQVSKNDPVLVLTQMHRKINSPIVSDLDCNKRQEGCNQIPREVRTESIQLERMGNCQNHCSMHNPSYLQRAMNFTASTNGKASMNSENFQVGTGWNACPLHASMLRQMPMNMNLNSAPVNQDHCESRGNGERFQMGRSQSQNHPQLLYSTIGQSPMKVNNPSKAPPVEPVTLKVNNSPLATVKTECGGEISVGAKEGRGNPVGLVTVKTEYGSESIAGAKEVKGNSVGLVTVKKEYGSESTAGAKEGKWNSVGLVTVKQEYGSEIIAGAKEGRGNSVRLAEAASLNVNATTNAENRGGMTALANVGGNAATVTESTLNSSEIAAGVTVGQSNAAEMLESARLKLKNLFDLTVLKTDYENQWKVTPDAKIQRGIVPGQKICSINTQVPNVDQLRSALAMSLSRFKDLTVLGTGAMPQTNGNLLAETTTYRKKRKRGIKETSIVRATEENASSNGDDRERVRKALMTYDALRRNLMNEDELCKEAGGVTRRADLKAGTMMMDRGQWINRGRRFIGPVPGVHVGDHFYFRMELCVIGLHGPSQAGIDFISAKNNQWNEPVAISIISSGGYGDNEDGGDVLIYTGQGGNNYISDKKQSVDQKLERGNLALERSMHYGVEIRVIRGVKDSKSPTGKIYIYDGLYKIEDSWLAKGRSGYGIFKYKLQRIPGQQELGSAILKNTRVWKAEPLLRVGLLHTDISLRSEKLPIFLANNVDNEKGPPHFEYTSRPLWYQNSLVQLDSSEGCACVGGCDPINCLCAQRNGKQMPYSSNGILIKGKPLIYECNEQCRCSLSCRNRVTQRGLNVQLEVFRTSDKRWGVRSWDPIAAGTFISEYTGQVVPVAEQAAICHSDGEYVLNLRHAQKRTEWGSVSDILCEEEQQQQAGSSLAFPALNFLIDANKFGNVSRFIKHSSCPNVLMQFVLHDHLDVRFPHVMLFARENIPPLTELTFDYGSVPSSDSEDSGEGRVLATVETVPEHNQSAIDYKYVVN
jgi:euchromatic histone-lysine N-methyltransferase